MKLGLPWEQGQVPRHVATADEAPSRTIRPASGRTTMKCTASTASAPGSRSPMWHPRSTTVRPYAQPTTPRPANNQQADQEQTHGHDLAERCQVDEPRPASGRSRVPGRNALLEDGGDQQWARARSESSRRPARPSARASSTGDSCACWACSERACPGRPRHTP